MGRNVYLTEKEISALRDASTQWCEMMGEGEETAGHVDEMLENGLGSALFKLYKGCNGEKIYRCYSKGEQNERDI